MAAGGRDRQLSRSFVEVSSLAPPVLDHPPSDCARLNGSSVPRCRRKPSGEGSSKGRVERTDPRLRFFPPVEPRARVISFVLMEMNIFGGSAARATGL